MLNIREGFKKKTLITPERRVGGEGGPYLRTMRIGDWRFQKKKTLFKDFPAWGRVRVECLKP